MDRRTLLRHFVATAACACPVCSTLVPRAAAAADHGAPHWAYEGHGGAAEWGALAPEYAACGAGREQSPIDLAKSIPAMMGDPAVSWKPVPLEVVNNGHTIQVNCGGGGAMMLDGISYDLLQFHFHHPSEHTVDGQTFDMECHFVHRNAAGGLAVLGVMISKGEANPTLETIWRAMPSQPDTVKSGVYLQPAALLPKDAVTFRYAGSLTTPPCSEVVSWVVYRQAVTASPEQIAQFAALFPMNARPVQPLNRRKLLLDAL
jgi:carbonic anhydrase